MSKTPFEDQPTQRVSGQAPSPSQTGASPFDARTVKVTPQTVRQEDQSGAAETNRLDGARPKPDIDGGATRLVRPGGAPAAAPEAPKPAPTAVTEDDANIPVVGWLVVVDGPGKGRSVTLGYGMNSVGRGTDNRVCLGFGDEQISRGAHFNVAYDMKSRSFFIQHGDAKNLTYLDDTPVLSPTAFTHGSIISVGTTTLRFVALCGADFDWEDLETDGGSKD